MKSAIINFIKTTKGCHESDILYIENKNYASIKDNVDFLNTPIVVLSNIYFDYLGANNNVVKIKENDSDNITVCYDTPVISTYVYTYKDIPIVGLTVYENGQIIIYIPHVVINSENDSDNTKWIDTAQIFTLLYTNQSTFDKIESIEWNNNDHKIFYTDYFNNLQLAITDILCNNYNNAIHYTDILKKNIELNNNGNIENQINQIINNINDQVDKLKKENKEIQRRILELEKEIEINNEHILNLYASKENVYNQTSCKESKNYQKILKQTPSLKSVWLKNNKLTLHYDSCKMVIKSSDKRFSGRIITYISYPYSSDDYCYLESTNLTDNGIPHVSDNGKICLGSFEKKLTENRKNIVKIVSTITDFITFPNISDGWGVRAKSYPTEYPFQKLKLKQSETLEEMLEQITDQNRHDEISL